MKWFALLDNVAVLLTGKEACYINFVQKEHLVLNANCQYLMMGLNLGVKEKHMNISYD